MQGFYREIVQRSDNGDITVALESLRDYSSQYLSLKINVAIRDDNADEKSFAHVMSPSDVNFSE